VPSILSTTLFAIHERIHMFSRCQNQNASYTHIRRNSPDVLQPHIANQRAQFDVVVAMHGKRNQLLSPEAGRMPVSIEGCAEALECRRR